MATSIGPPWTSVSPALRCLPSIARLGFPSMTPVQAACIPALLTHKDVCVQACTGSGKTLAFVIPMMEMLLRRVEPPRSAKPLGAFQVGAIIISPTRELADQILDVTRHFTNDYSQFRLMGFIGGTDAKLVETDFRTRGANILVATPGILLTLLMTVDIIDLRELELLVLDEADRLLDLGFEKTLDNILQRLPKQRRTGLFSATQTSQLVQLARAGLRNPVKIEVQVQYTKQLKKKTAEDAQMEVSLTPSSLQNFYMTCAPGKKVHRLIQFLLANSQRKTIVFFLTCAMVDYFAKVLPQLSCCKQLNIVGMHGKQAMKKRTANFRKFSGRSSGVLLCTDVAARGIDIPDIDCILQFDPPQDPNMFVHRIGRTARMNRSGTALVMLLPTEDSYIPFLKLKKVPIEEHVPAPLLDVDPAAEIRSLALNDRAVMENGQCAFVSFVRAYKEHRCSFIFVFNQLPFAELAQGWGLLMFPRMADLKHLHIQFDSGGIKAADIKFKDPQREAQRLANLEADKLKRLKEQKDRQEKQKKALKAKEQAGPKRRNKKIHQEMVEEWDDLAQEQRLLKKLKKGQISQEEYDTAVGED